MTKFTILCLLVFLFMFAISVSCAVMDFELELVRDKHFIVGTVEMPPYIHIHRDRDGKLREVDGFVNRILVFLASKFHFTYEYVEPSSGHTGHCFNDTCNGLIGMLIRGEIDLIATGLALSQSRSKLIDFTFQFQSDFENLLIPYPHKDATLDSITEPFHYEVWIFILMSILICSFFLYWIGYFENFWLLCKTFSILQSQETARKRAKYTDHIMFLLSVLINPGNMVLPAFGEAFRILVAVWCLAAVVIANSYTTSIKSFLTMPRYRPMINSLEDLAQKPDYFFIVQKYSSIWSEMLSATTGTFAKIGETLRKHPENSFEKLTDDVTLLVANKKKVLAEFRSSSLVRIEEDLKAMGGECRLYTAKNPFGESKICFGIPKNSHHLNHFLSHEIMWLKQSGLLDYWMKLFWPKTNRCSAPISTEPSKKAEKLTMNYLSGAFLLLGFGMLLSFCVFIIEQVGYQWQHRHPFALRKTREESGGTASGQAVIDIDIDIPSNSSSSSSAIKHYQQLRNQ